jgi:hypothetical protein
MIIHGSLVQLNSGFPLHVCTFVRWNGFSSGSPKSGKCRHEDLIVIVACWWLSITTSVLFYLSSASLKIN